MRRHAGLLMAVLACGGAAARATAPAPPAMLGKDTPQAAVYRGSIVYTYYCVLCHGSKADGTGRAAKLYTPPPANLVMSDKNDDYKRLIIRLGGKALGRSEFMPAWDKELTDEQISDVVAYLASIHAPAPHAGHGAPPSR